MAIRADNIGSKISIDDIRDFIPDDHPCFLVEKIVERVDFSEGKSFIGILQGILHIILVFH
jgi:transposase